LIHRRQLIKVHHFGKCQAEGAAFATCLPYDSGSASPAFAAIRASNPNDVIGSDTASFGSNSGEADDHSRRRVTLFSSGALSFGMEFIEGHFQKLGAISGSEFDRIADLFAKEKINYVKDACAILEDGKVTKIIDFGMEEIELWHGD